MSHRSLVVAPCALAVLVVALGVQPAAAVLVAQDSFEIGGPPNYSEATPSFDRNDNSSDGQIKPGSTGQNPTSPGFGGVGGEWTGPATSLWKIQDFDLTFTNHPTSGGSAQFDWNSGTFTRQMSRPITGGVPTIDPGDTFWMSGLVRHNAVETDNEGAAYAGFGDTSTNAGISDPGGATFFAENPNGWRVGLEATGSGGLMDLVFRHQDTAGLVMSETLLSDVTPGDVNMVVIRGTADADAGFDEITVWVNPEIDGPNLELSFGGDFQFTDSSMDAGAFDLFLLQGFDIDNADSNPEGGILFDEFRLGTTLQDVVPNGVLLVPEPAGMTLSILPALLLLGRKRRNPTIR